MVSLRVVAEQILKPRARYSAHEVPVYLGHEPRREEDGDVRLARDWLADHPADGGESVTTEWLVQSGGRITSWHTKACGDPNKDSDRYPHVKYGPFVWYTNLWTGDGKGGYVATYFLKYQGACLGCSPELTRDQFRHLCAGLGVEHPLHGEQAREGGEG